MLLAYRGARTVPPGLAQRFLRGCGVDEWVEETNAGDAGLKTDTKLEKEEEESMGGIEEVVEEIWRKVRDEGWADFIPSFKFVRS